MSRKAARTQAPAASERAAARRILSAVTAFEPPGVAWTRDATRGETGHEPHPPGKDILPHGALSSIYRQAGERRRKSFGRAGAACPGHEPHPPGKDIPHGTLTRMYRLAGGQDCCCGVPALPPRSAAAGDHLDERLRITFELLLPDAGKRGELVEGARLLLGHRFEGHVVEDDVGRHALRLGELPAAGA